MLDLRQEQEGRGRDHGILEREGVTRRRLCFFACRYCRGGRRARRVGPRHAPRQGCRRTGASGRHHSYQGQTRASYDKRGGRTYFVHRTCDLDEAYS